MNSNTMITQQIAGGAARALSQRLGVSGHGPAPVMIASVILRAGAQRRMADARRNSTRRLIKTRRSILDTSAAPQNRRPQQRAGMLGQVFGEKQAR